MGSRKEEYFQIYGNLSNIVDSKDNLVRYSKFDNIWAHLGKNLPSPGSYFGRMEIQF